MRFVYLRYGSAWLTVTPMLAHVKPANEGADDHQTNESTDNDPGDGPAREAVDQPSVILPPPIAYPVSLVEFEPARFASELAEGALLEGRTLLGDCVMVRTVAVDVAGVTVDVGAVELDEDDFAADEEVMVEEVARAEDV